MARPTPPRSRMAVQQVSGNRTRVPKTLSGSAAVYRPNRPTAPKNQRRSIAKEWQRNAYRHMNICGEARYSVALFSALAGRAEIGVSEPNALNRKAVWVKQGVEVEAFSELAPTVRERTQLIRNFMLHWTIAGECYLIARDRQENDPEYGYNTMPVWEIVAVTELRRVGQGEYERWQVRYDNENYIDLDPSDPVIRMWNPDPNDRREAWSPIRSMLPTLDEIEWATKNIFTQIRSRLMLAGVWFLPDNLTFAPPPPDAVEGGAEAIAQMNEAEQFMASLAASSMALLSGDEVAFPSVVMSDAAALEQINAQKLIKFWSEIDDKVMLLRNDAVRRFALGMDLPPEQILGSSGIAVSGSSGSAGSVNHWGVWANEEQTISAHIEPALDNLVSVLTSAFLRAAVEGTLKVIAYDTASLRLRQDRSKEAIQLHEMGLLKGEVTVREVGFDPENDMMDDEEFRRWLLTQIAKGSATPEMVMAANLLLGIELPVPERPVGEVAPGQPGRALPRNTDAIPVKGPPQGDHEHRDAPYALTSAPDRALVASCEGLVLRALEKAGNRLLNDGKRGKDRDRSTPAHLAHVGSEGHTAPEFDFTTLPTVFGTLPVGRQYDIGVALSRYCTRLYNEGAPYTRDALIEAVKGL